MGVDVNIPNPLVNDLAWCSRYLLRAVIFNAAPLKSNGHNDEVAVKIVIIILQ